MRANITDERYQHARAVYADPICGTDFCDECGDCLYCYGGDECRDGGDRCIHRRFFLHACCHYIAR